MISVMAKVFEGVFDDLSWDVLGVKVIFYDLSGIIRAPSVTYAIRVDDRENSLKETCYDLALILNDHV